MKRASKFLLRPTGQQNGLLLACLEDHRQRSTARWSTAAPPTGWAG